MADIVVTTTNVYDVAAGIYGLWQCFEALGDQGSDLLADLKSALRPDDREIVPTIVDQDDVLMLASYDAWEKTIPADPLTTVNGMGRMVTTKTRVVPQIIVPPRGRGANARPSRKNDVRAQNMAMITAAMATPVDDDELEYGDELDYGDELGFIGPAIRAAGMGAAILFRRVGARAALGVVATFAKRGASRLAKLASSTVTKALATRASKFLLVAGAIAIGEKFVVSTAKNIASGATAVGKGALWLIAAYAAYTFLADHRRKSY